MCSVNQDIFTYSIAQSLQRGGYGLDERGSAVDRRRDSFSPPPRPDRPWGPQSPLSNGCRELFSRW